MTDAERLLLDLTLERDAERGGSCYQNHDPIGDAARAVLRERTKQSAIDEYKSARMAFLAASQDFRDARGSIGLPGFISSELDEQCEQEHREQIAARYVYTGVRASDEQERVMREAFSVPLIGRNAGGGPPPQKVVHDTALACGLPEIRGFYGYHFKRHEFVHEPGANEREPDEWKR
jgi:hypothetical protein